MDTDARVVDDDRMSGAYISAGARDDGRLYWRVYWTIVGGTTSGSTGGTDGGGPEAFLEGCKTPCEPVCRQCDDPGFYQACMAHESLHCRQDEAVCDALQEQHTQHGINRTWDDYAGDYDKLLQNEVDAYGVSNGVLERILNNRECYRSTNQ